MTNPSPRADNVSRLQWRQASISWDGDAYRLELPHYFDAWPALWLDRNLTDRVRAVPGCEDWQAAVTEAVPTRRQGRSVGWDAPGHISLQNVRHMPDMQRLREVLIEAVREAERVSEIAEREADTILKGFIGNGAR